MWYVKSYAYKEIKPISLHFLTTNYANHWFQMHISVIMLKSIKCFYLLCGFAANHMQVCWVREQNSQSEAFELVSGASSQNAQVFIQRSHLLCSTSFLFVNHSLLG